MEVNFSPSLNTDSPLDLEIKSSVLVDLFNLVRVPCFIPAKSDTSSVVRAIHSQQVNFSRVVRVVIFQSFNYYFFAYSIVPFDKWQCTGDVAAGKRKSSVVACSSPSSPYDKSSEVVGDRTKEGGKSAKNPSLHHPLSFNRRESDHDEDLLCKGREYNLESNLLESLSSSMSYISHPFTHVTIRLFKG